MRPPVSFLFSSLHKPSYLSISLYGPWPSRWSLLDSLQCVRVCLLCTRKPNTEHSTPYVDSVLNREEDFSWPAGYTLADETQDAVGLCCNDTLWAARANSLRTGKILAISQQHPTPEHPANSKTPRTSSQVRRWLLPCPEGHSLQLLSSATMFCTHLFQSQLTLVLPFWELFFLNCC